jgi:hypothetical protein
MLPNCLSTSAHCLIVNTFLVWVQKIAVVQTDHLMRGIGSFWSLRGSSFEAYVVEVISPMVFDPWWRDDHAVPKRRALITQWHGVIFRIYAAAKVWRLTLCIKLAATAVWQILFSAHRYNQSLIPTGHCLTYSFDTAIRRPEGTEHNN